jgi:hypothetical protein
MNERIKELAEQAGINVSQKNYGYYWVESADGIEKFAELIVKECAKVAVFKDSGMAASADVAGYMAAGRSTAARMIKQHFGVEL